MHIDWSLAILLPVAIVAVAFVRVSWDLFRNRKRFF